MTETVEPQKKAFQYKAVFDANRDLMAQIREQYTINGTNIVSWKKALDQHPEWRQTLNIHTPEARNYASTWMHKNFPGKSKHGRGNYVRRPKKSKAAQPAIEVAKPRVSTGANYCPNCGCNLRAVATAMEMTGL